MPAGAKPVELTVEPTPGVRRSCHIAAVLTAVSLACTPTVGLVNGCGIQTSPSTMNVMKKGLPA
jgi:hypothetical protein